MSTISKGNNIYKQASAYAQQQGLNLTSVIEDFLKRFIVRSKAANAREAYSQYYHHSKR